MKTKQWIAAAVSFGLLVALCGCGSSTPEGPSGSTGSGTGSTATAAPTTEAPRDYNYLTGENSLIAGSTTRPVAVMIANDSRARPQKGIDKADLYLESETEAGISRIMAVFANRESLPDELGPVRSARTHYVRMADALDAVLIHAGGSPKAKERIRLDSVPEIDACGADGKAFWRDAVLRKTNGYDHSLITSRAKATGRWDKKKYRTQTTTKAPFSFGDKQGSAAATGLQVKLSASQTINFTYDSARKVYLKGNGKLENAKPHTAEDGTQIYAQNVIVMFASRFKEDASHVTFELDNGSGLLLTGGTAREIKWTRTDSQLSYRETDGTPLTVATGKTYICLCSSAYRSGTVYQ